MRPGLRGLGFSLSAGLIEQQMKPTNQIKPNHIMQQLMERIVFRRGTGGSSRMHELVRWNPGWTPWERINTFFIYKDFSGRKRMYYPNIT